MMWQAFPMGRAQMADNNRRQILSGRIQQSWPALVVAFGAIASFLWAVAIGWVLVEAVELII